MSGPARADDQPRRPFVSLGTRLTVPVVALVALVTVCTYFGLIRSSRASALRYKEEAADMVVKLTALSVVPAVVFGDEIEMKRAVGDLARNPQVMDVELWGNDAGPGDQPSLASFHRAGERPLPRPRTALSSRSYAASSVTAVEPLKGPDNAIIGTLSVRFSTAREEATLAALSRQVLWVSLGTALLLSVAILWVLRGLVLSPIHQLQQAARSLASGQPALPEEAASAPRVDDEVVQLAASFREMSDAVRDRERRLGVRNAELRLILDSVKQGFLSVRPDGSLQPERSAIFETWVGLLPEPAYLWDVHQRVDPRLGEFSRAGWDQLADDILPLEMALAQLPQRGVRGNYHFDFAYHPVLNGNILERVVVVMTDVSAEVERQRALADQHEFSVLVDQFVRDRRWFQAFWNEASALVARIAGPEAGTGAALRRDLHTLKGNARFFSLNRLAELCHSLEDYLAEHAAQDLDAAGRAQLGDAWAALQGRMQPLVGNAEPFVAISQEDHSRLMEGLRARRPHEVLLELVRGMRNEPTEVRLKRAEQVLLQVCDKLGKTPPAVVIEHNDLRIPPERFAAFWAVLPHVLGNAADHGIESDEERQSLGKVLPAQVRLSTRLVGSELWVEVADDGRGIDWAAVRKKAIDVGLPHATSAELEQALLSDGFSLASEVSEISGRGVGLAAVRDVVSALGGRVELESREGRGTVWLFRLNAAGAEQASDEGSRPRAVY